MNLRELMMGEGLVFGPFRTEWFQRAVTEELREAILLFIEEVVVPQIEGEITGMQGVVSSHYDHPQFQGRADLAQRFYLQLRFEANIGVVGAVGEVVFDAATGRCVESQVKPFYFPLLEGPRRPLKPIEKPKRVASTVQFPVADVVPCFDLLPEVPLRECLPRLVRTRLLVCPDADRAVVPGVTFHPLIAAAAMAYQKHYPLVLSPDMVWLTILQGVSQHIQNNAERLRSRLVHHQTKIELVANLGTAGLPSDSGEMLAVAEAFVEQIWRHVEPGKRPLLEARFSTTTIAERIAGGVVIMEAFQDYFDYVFGIICGIPAVLLEGTVADWELLEGKVQALEESDLDLAWWTGQLRPLCRQFVRAARGEVDTAHWKDLCKVEAFYGVNDLNGWLLKFIPYVRYEKDERLVHLNPVLGLGPQRPPREVWGGKLTGCTSDMLPAGISEVPVSVLNQETGQVTPVRFVAGFTGLEQACEDLGLRPVVGWAIAGPTIDRLLEIIRTLPGCQPRKNPEEPLEDYPNLSGDIRRYYSHIYSVDFKFAKRNPWGHTRCYVLPPEEVKLVWDTDSAVGELEYLLAQGLITQEVFEEWSAFLRNYGALYCIARANGGKSGSWYVMGESGPSLRKGRFIIGLRNEARRRLRRWRIRSRTG